METRIRLCDSAQWFTAATERSLDGTQSKSRELLHWWTGQLPDEMEEYHAQGIGLQESDSQLTQTLEHYYQISPCFIKFGHPLKRSKISNWFVNMYNFTPCYSGANRLLDEWSRLSPIFARHKKWATSIFVKPFTHTLQSDLLNTAIWQLDVFYLHIYVSLVIHL